MSTPLSRLVGARLREMRDGKGWTQADAAQAIGVKPVTYANMEAGRKNPTLRQVAKYAAGFRVDPLTLFQPKQEAAQ